MDTFGQSLNETSNADLVDHLGKLARADRSHEADHTRISIDNWPGTLENGFRRADHYRENAVLGTGLTTGDGGVDEMKAALLCFDIQFTSNLRRGCCVVDEDRVLLHG